ncbi:MAG: L,D-transpeptidase [Rhizobiaceae bacterium]|nr:L,D-transpeptidase [Rhizobiaceae bacterium]
MINRRSLLSGLAFALVPGAAFAQKARTFQIDPAYVPQSVAVQFDYAPGTVVVDAPNRFLYLMEAPGTARRYGVGVGRTGLTFAGTAEVGRKAKWPWWRPTANMIKRNPKKYKRYSGGMKGGPGNPLGSRALYLYRDGQDTLYRIHGTTEPWSIGQAVSNGCIRMVNEHVEDLYERVPVGASVVVLR